MARKGIFRRNTLVLAIVALSGIILFGLVANESAMFFTGFEAVPFTVPIPLSIAENRSIECRIWTQGNIVDVDGGKTDIGFDTQTFTPQFQLDVLNIRTEKEISEIDTEIRIRCDPFGNAVTNDNYVLTGGTVEYFWTAKDQDDTVRIVTQKITQNISPSSLVLQDPNGPGVTIAKPKVTGKAIDQALTSTNEVYFTSAALVITAMPQFHFTLKSGSTVVLEQDEFATVNLHSGVGTIKIFNEQLDLPVPTSNVVKLKSISFESSNDEVIVLDNTMTNIDIDVRIELPNCNNGLCGSPRIDLFRPSTSGDFFIHQGNIPITAKKLIDENTQTYEFFDTNISLPDEPKAGTWAIKAYHTARTGEDTKTFFVADKKSQSDPEKTGRSDDKPKTNPCDQLTGQAKEDCEEGRSGDDDEQDGGAFNFLNFGEFVACFSEANQFSCLNDGKFLPIYVIFGLIIAISILAPRKS